MSNIRRYNSIAAKPESKSAEILELLQIKEGYKILEIGIGGGYFAGLFLKKIGENGLYCGVDTDQKFLDNMEAFDSPNVKTIKAGSDGFSKPDIKFDIIFSRNSYHHINNRARYFGELNGLLNDNGRLAIIDYNEKFSLARIFGHYTKTSVIINEMAQAGFKLNGKYDIFNKQSFLTFSNK